MKRDWLAGVPGVPADLLEARQTWPECPICGQVYAPSERSAGYVTCEYCLTLAGDRRTDDAPIERTDDGSL